LAPIICSGVRDASGGGATNAPSNDRSSTTDGEDVLDTEPELAAFVIDRHVPSLTATYKTRHLNSPRVSDIMHAQ
jgi:hypothetical protein